MEQNEINALIEEAKKRYPIGTKFRVAHIDSVIRTVKSHNFNQIVNDDHHINVNVALEVNKNDFASIYTRRFGWAKIVSIPEIKEQPEFKILSYIGKLSGAIWKLNEERGEYFHNNIYLRDTKSDRISIHSVMNKDGNTFDIGDEITLIEGVNKGNRFTITGFRMKKDDSTVCAITNTHTPYGVGINRIEHFIEKEPEFILPEKWCIKTTNMDEIIKAWFLSKDNSFVFGHNYYGNCPFNNRSNLNDYGGLGMHFIPNFSNIEITNEQFKKYVLKEEEPVVIPNETLLEKAKRLYPVGTRFINPIDNKECVIRNEGYYFEGNANNIYHSISYDKSKYLEGLSGCIYVRNKWAEIIEEVGPKVGDRFQLQENKFNNPTWSPVHTIEKFEGSLRNPNSVISFTGNYPGAKTQTVLLKNVKFIKDEK